MRININQEIKLINVVTFLITIVLYAYLFWALDRGISSDEGWYLSHYLFDIKQSGVSDYAIIICQIFGFLDFENALELRYFYFFFSLPVIGIFAFSSHAFLKKKENLSIDKTFYILSVFLLAVFSYTFATPVFYYDTIQYLLFLLIFSLLFCSELYPKTGYISYCSVGLLLLFTLTNYLPSGLLLGLFLLAWMFFYKKKPNVYIWAFFGFLFSCIIYHFFIHSLVDYVSFVVDDFINQTGESDSLTLPSHSSSDLLMVLLLYILKSVIFAFSVLFIAFLVYYYVFKLKNNFTKVILLLFFYGVLLLISFFYRVELGTWMFLIPILLLIAEIFVKKYTLPDFRLSFSKSDFLFLFFLCIPLIGIFGTNQPFERKTMIFLVFWLVAYYVLYSKYKSILSKFSKKTLSVLLCCFVPVFFMTYGFNSRCHNYYGIRKASFYLEDMPRLGNVKLVAYQKNFIEHLNHTLKENGFVCGDTILAFEVDLMATYAVGASMPESVYYTHKQMINRRFLPDRRLKYIMLSKRAEKEFADYLQDTDWEFPEKYNRIDVGKFAENMQDEYTSILYVLKFNED